MTILGGFLNGSLVPILDHVQSVQFMSGVLMQSLFLYYDLQVPGHITTKIYHF